MIGRYFTIKRRLAFMFSDNSAFDVCDLGGDDLSFIPVPAIVNIYNTEI